MLRKQERVHGKHSNYLQYIIKIRYTKALFSSNNGVRDFSAVFRWRKKAGRCGSLGAAEVKGQTRQYGDSTESGMKLLCGMGGTLL